MPTLNTLNTLNTLKPTPRPLAGHLAILMLLAILAVFSILKAGGIGADVAMVHDVAGIAQHDAIDARDSVQDMAILLRDVVLLDDPAGPAAMLDDIDRRAASYRASAGAMSRMADADISITPSEHDILVGLRATDIRTMPIIDRVVQLRQAGHPDQAKAFLIRDARPALTQWLRQINSFIDIEAQKNHVAAHRAQRDIRGFQDLMLAVCGSALLSVATGFWCIRPVSPPVGLTAMRDPASGGRGVVMPGGGHRDGIAAMAGAVETFNANAIAGAKPDARLARREVESAARRMPATDALAIKFQNGVGMQAAAAAGRIDASIRDIGQQMSRPATIPVHAIEDAGKSDEIAPVLESAAERIGQAVDMLAGVAARTSRLWR